MTRHLRRFVPLLHAHRARGRAWVRPDPGWDGGFDFGMDLGIGVATFADGTWQSLSLTPDLALGKFGIGLDVKLNYRFTGGSGNEFEIRAADWVPTDFQDFLNIYLPKIMYVRWDEKGAPLYVKLGSIDDGTLGNGFIMGGYANTLFVPDDRHFGLAFDLDGALFKFPYVGLETFVGDLAEFDVLGARLFVRPLIWLGVPIIKDLQVGATYAMDLKPYLYDDPLDHRDGDGRVRRRTRGCRSSPEDPEPRGVRRRGHDRGRELRRHGGLRRPAAVVPHLRCAAARARP